MSRNDTVYASRYSRTPVQVSQFYPNEARTITVDFNGAMDADRLIESATFKTFQRNTVVMSDPTLTDDQRKANLKIKAQIGGPAVVQCTAVLDNGDVLNQQWRIEVTPTQIYTGTTWDQGPDTITVTNS